MGVCCCLQICNSVVNMAVKGLVFGQSVMVASYAKVPPFMSFVVVYT